MKPFLILLLLLSSLSWSKSLDINDTLPNITLNDQFGNSHTIDKNVSKIIITFDKKSSVLANKFISSKKDSSHYLNESNMAFIANISAMPSLINKLFAMPKMKKYKHTILLINDDANDMFLSKKRHISIYDLENAKIKSITYIKGIEELNTSLQR
jgi:hypothetical protein